MCGTFGLHEPAIVHGGRVVLCKYCGSKVADHSPFCPVCGLTLKPVASNEPSLAGGTKGNDAAESPGVLWYLALALLASALVSATIGLGLLGMRQGVDHRESRSRELALQYYRRGQAHFQEGNYLLALAELEEAVRLAPDHGEAREQLTLVQALLEGRAMPTSAALGEAVIVLYEEARALYADDRWESVIVKLEQLSRLDSSYRRQEVEEMLFHAHHQEARAFVEAGELEHALAHVDSALEIRPYDSTASELRVCLSLYLVGLTQTGADWERAVETFQRLYTVNPDFLDVAHKLHDAYLNLGDVYYAEGAWCVAERQYGAALQVMVMPTAVAKRDQARQRCVEAVSSATPPAAPTVAPTSTVTAISSIPRGSYVGEFAGYVPVSPVEMRVRVHVVDSQGDGMPGVEVVISVYDWPGDTKLTDADGYCEFAGLTQEAEFTVRLTQVPCDPVQVSTLWGEEALLEFVER